MFPSRRLLIPTLIVLLLAGCAPVEEPASESDSRKSRVLVLTDIENEPDDAQSLVRFLVYANEYDVEGVLATTSVWMRDTTRADKIRGHVAAYGKVRDNLHVHKAEYPPAEDLMQKVMSCKPVYGMEGVGAGMDTEGSEHIISVVDKEDDRPVWISVWGGANCLAQALWKVRETRSAEELDVFVSKLRVYTISDQDDSGPWMREQFPNLFYIVTPSNPRGSEGYGRATWVGISGDNFHGNFSGPDSNLVENPWLRENVINGHGPLGARYPEIAYLMEGDTPSFFNLIKNGLASHVSPSYGGWGGRYRHYQPEGEPRAFWTNDADSVFAPDGNWYNTNHATIWRWREGYQYDFAARMDWCVAPNYADANHNPVAVVNGDESVAPIYLDVSPGEELALSAEGSYDPDEDGFTYSWWVYREAGTYPGSIPVRDDAAPVSHLTIPEDAAGTEIHVILELVDDGEPPLRGYRRVVLLEKET